MYLIYVNVYRDMDIKYINIRKKYFCFYIFVMVRKYGCYKMICGYGKDNIYFFLFYS